jgi:hypothetical protein
MSQMPVPLTGVDPETLWADGNPANITKAVSLARAEGYINLTPIQRQFALEFVLSGTTLRKIARLMDVPQPFVQKMYNNPVVRAYIADLQKEVAAHKLVNDQWVENQIMKVLPMLMGEVPVDIVTSKGSHVRKRKFHAAEIASLLKHFGGGVQDSKTGFGAGGVNIQINLADMLSPEQAAKLNLKVVGE